VDFYAKYDWHHENVASFRELVKEFPALNLFFPNKEKAPWHVQAMIEGTPYSIMVNFWPHVMKGQRDGCHAVEGYGGIHDMLIEAFNDAAIGDDFELIED